MYIEYRLTGLVKSRHRVCRCSAIDQVPRRVIGGQMRQAHLQNITLQPAHTISECQSERQRRVQPDGCPNAAVRNDCLAAGRIWWQPGPLRAFTRAEVYIDHPTRALCSYNECHTSPEVQDQAQRLRMRLHRPYGMLAAHGLSRGISPSTDHWLVHLITLGT